MIKEWITIYLLLMVFSCQENRKPAIQSKSLPIEEPSLAPSKPLLKKPDFRIAGLTEMEVKHFLDSLKQITDKKQWKKLAPLISYPCNITIGDTAFKIITAEDFLKRPQILINSKILKVLQSQQFEELFVNWQGVRIGKGELWIAGVDSKAHGNHKDYVLRIIAINHF